MELIRPLHRENVPRLSKVGISVAALILNIEKEKTETSRYGKESVKTCSALGPPGN